MPLIASDKGGKGFDPVPEGTYNAVCYSLVDLGTHLDEKFGNRNHKVNITWEIPSERILIEKDGQTLDLPRAISKQYTISLNEKANLRKDLQTWRGRAFTEEELGGFDIKNVLGKSCLLQVIHTKKGEKTYANVTAVIAYPKGMEALKTENPQIFYSIADDRDVIPQGVPQWLIDIILTSDEFKAFTPAEAAHPPTETGAVEDDVSDSVPF
jgi:hypothetical protein